MTTSRAPKQWLLTNWKQNLQYTLSLDANFAPFLITGITWGKKTRTAGNRNLTDDGADVPEAQRKTAAQKLIQLELMLGQIASFCPVISRNSIIKNSTSINDIWQLIRSHYGFQLTGSHQTN